MISENRLMAMAAKNPARMVLPPSRYTSHPRAPPKPPISLPGPRMLNTRVKAMHPAKAHRQGKMYGVQSSMDAASLQDLSDAQPHGGAQGDARGDQNGLRRPAEAGVGVSRHQLPH